MAVIEIQAKVILSHIRPPDGLFGLDYNMNLYRGCQHQCIYCDSRSECYQIENFADILVKINAPELLEKELAKKRVKGSIGTGSMNDPYMPVERQYGLTRKALELIARYRFGVHVLTKSDLVTRDIDLLEDIGRVDATVGFSISTTDDALARKLEPGAPPPSSRYQAMRALSKRGIATGVLLMPILPFLEDSVENITAVVQHAMDHGASFIVPWFGMSMRDRQRSYFYDRLDRLFPGLRKRYEQTYGERYECPVPNARQLEEAFHDLRTRYGFETRMPRFPRTLKPDQLTLF